MHLRTRFALGGAALVGALLLAACGGSATNGTATPAATTVTAKDAATLGKILADAKGFTLYTLTDNGKPVDCTGACAAVWPPLTAASGSAPTAAPAAGTVGMTTLADGTSVVTSGGLPLYHYVKDLEPDDAYGDGLSSFGGVWHVVKTGPSTAAGASVQSPVSGPSYAPGGSYAQ